MVPTILVLVIIIGIGGGVWAYINRTPKSIDAGISSFQRELHALAPRTTRPTPPKAESGLPVVGSGSLSADDAPEVPDDQVTVPTTSVDATPSRPDVVVVEGPTAAEAAAESPAEPAPAPAAPAATTTDEDDELDEDFVDDAEDT